MKDKKCAMTVCKIVHTPKDQLSVTENYFYDWYALYISVGTPYGSDMTPLEDCDSM